LLGVIPFFALVLLIVVKIIHVLAWMRRTGDVRHAAVPIAMVLTAGLVHAVFEDWLFAAGYYLCFFFWSYAFMLFDVAPATVLATSVSGVRSSGFRWSDRVDLVSSLPRR